MKTERDERGRRDQPEMLLARLPSVHALQRHTGISALRDRFEDRQINTAIRKTLHETRNRIRFRPREAEATGLAPQRLAERVAGILEAEVRSAEGELINASGILFHPRTRNQYAGTAARRASKPALALVPGEDDGRTGRLLNELTGAEDALVTRSVSAAFLLAVRALAEGQEIVINRGQAGLIDAPYDGRPLDPVSICRLAGASVVEAGATNKTRLSDYLSVLGSRTALIVTVRPSTYALHGFVEETRQEEVVRAAVENGVTVLHLAGDTTLRPVVSAAYAPACSVSEAVQWGTSLIIAAGGGLIGGPPCGLLIGNRHVMAQMRRHSLWPAVQAAGHVQAGLDARLKELANSQSDLECHPAAHMLIASGDEVRCRARRLLDSLLENDRAGAACSVVERQAHLTAYRLPGDGMPSFAVLVRSDGIKLEDLANRWLEGTPALLADCCRDWIRIDLRGVKKSRIPEVAHIVGIGLEGL